MRKCVREFKHHARVNVQHNFILYYYSKKRPVISDWFRL